MNKHARRGPARQTLQWQPHGGPGKGASHGLLKARGLGGLAKRQLQTQAAGPVRRKQMTPAAAAPPQTPPPLPAGKQPLRTRAEGGRKRRKKGA